MARLGVDSLYAQFLCMIFFAAYHTIIYQLLQISFRTRGFDCRDPREVSSSWPQIMNHSASKVTRASIKPSKLAEVPSLLHNSSISWLKFCVVVDSDDDGSIFQTLLSIRKGIGINSHIHADIMDFSILKHRTRLSWAFPEFHFRSLQNWSSENCLEGHPETGPKCSIEQENLRIVYSLQQCAANVTGGWVILLDASSQLCDHAIEQMITLFHLMDDRNHRWRAARFSPYGAGIAVRSSLTADFASWLSRPPSPLPTISNPLDSNGSDSEAAGPESDYWPADQNYVYPGSLFRRGSGQPVPGALARAAALLAPHANRSAPAATAAACAAATLRDAAAPIFPAPADSSQNPPFPDPDVEEAPVAERPPGDLSYEQGPGPGADTGNGTGRGSDSASPPLPAGTAPGTAPGASG